MAGKREEQLKEITERLEQGVQEIFTSERYADYLRTMSQFHTYSFNNTLLIAMQKPDATLVAGYQAWQKKFHRQVKRGEKGIQIISPAPIRRKEERDKVDEQTGQVILKPDGDPEKEEVVHVIPKFKVATVFDVSQTVGEPLPELGAEELTASVENYDAFMAALTQVSPVHMRFDEIAGEAKGFYNNETKEIVLQSGMSESQTLKTAIHEIAHARLHDRELMREQGIEKNQMTKEVEAESVAYTVCQQFGIDTSDYSFAYVASWSSGMDMRELRASMDTIRHTAAEFIEELTGQIQLQREQQEQYREAFVYQELEIFGVPALFSNGRIADDDIPKGFYRYDLGASDDNPGIPVTVQNTVAVNHAATILTMYPLNLPEQGFLYLGEEMNFTGGEISVQEYRQRMADTDISALAENMQNAVLRANENLLWEDSGERYAIYQLKDNIPGDSYRFMNMDYVNRHDMRVSGFDYKLVYGGELASGDTLEGLYERFNIDRPESFTGHSLSVSDVVLLNRSGVISTHYVDSVGFEVLPEFLQERQVTWTQQVTMEPETMEDVIGEKLEDKAAAESLQDREAQEAETIGNPENSISDRSADKDILENLDVSKPLYRHNGSYAYEHGELRQYRESRHINVACKNTIEKAVADNYDGMHLNDGVAKPVVDQFGAERVSYILANTLRHKPEDGRFSMDNRSWAENVPMTAEDVGGRSYEWVVNSHPAVLNGFIRQARDEIAQLEQEKVSVAFYYVDCDMKGDRTEGSYREFQDIDSALSEYIEIPNHLDKEIGMSSTEMPPSRMTLIRCKNGVDTLYDMEEESLSGKWVTRETIDAQNRAQFYLDNHDVEIAYYIEPSDHYIAIQTISEGYDYTIYDGNFHHLDGGIYDNTDLSIIEAMEEILSDAKLSAWPGHREVMDYSELMQKASAVARDEIRKTQEKAQKMMQERKSALSGQQQKEEIPLISDQTEPCISLRGKSMADIEETALCYAQAQLDSMGLQDDVKLLGARVYGSRSRKGLYTNDSDVDVVLSYTGSIGEDDFFNALHESGLSINGMPVDINPISTEKTGTLSEYLQRADHYLDEKAAQMAENPQLQNTEMNQDAEKPRITFYVAECMEFPVLGEWHEEITSLSEAMALYEKIPAERMNGIKGIGFTLYDGSMYDGMQQEMMSAGIVDRDDVNEIQQYKQSPLVQKALDELEAVYATKSSERKTMQTEVREAPGNEERTAPEPEKTPQMVSAENSKESKDMGSFVVAGDRKESVLQALRERKAKMKEQGKMSGKEQDRKSDRKKGEQSL